MFNYHPDQADGLRRIMGTGQPRVVSILSASDNQNQSRLLSNLAASINAYGKTVIIVHACNQAAQASYHVESIPALLDVATEGTLLVNAIKMSDQGFAVAKLTHEDHTNIVFDAYESQQLEFVFEELMHEYDVVLVDASINEHHLLPLPSLNENEILIELSREQDSIQQAYSLMKRICTQIGSRSFSIVVDDATDTQAKAIFNNISKVAWRYLNIQLSFFGAIPTDIHLTRAAMLGRSVIDAFPTAIATTAFQKIAQRLDYTIELDDEDSSSEHASFI